MNWQLRVQNFKTKQTYVCVTVIIDLLLYDG